MGVQPRPWGYGKGGREAAAKALVAWPRRPWGRLNGSGARPRRTRGCDQCPGGAAKVAIEAQPRTWGSGQGSRVVAVKAVEARPRRPWKRSQGPGGVAKAALGVRPMPCGRGQGGCGGNA